MGRKSGVDESIPLLYILGPAYEGYFGEAALRTPRRVHKGDHALLTSLSRRQRQDVATKALMSSVAPAASLKDSVTARGHRTAGPSRTMTHGVDRQSTTVRTPAGGRARTHDVNMRLCEHIKPRTPLALHGGARTIVDPQASIGRPAADPHEGRTAPTVEHDSRCRQGILSKAGGLTRLPAAATLKSWAPPPQRLWLTPSCTSVERPTGAKAVQTAAVGELHQPNNEELKKLKVIEIPCPRRDMRMADMDGLSQLDSLSSFYTEASTDRVKRSPYPPNPAFMLQKQEWRGGGFLLKIRRETHTQCRPKQGPASSVKAKAGFSVCGSSVSSSTNIVRATERESASDMRLPSPSSDEVAPSTDWASAVELPAAGGSTKQEEKHKLEIVLCTPPTSAYDDALGQT